MMDLKLPEKQHAASPKPSRHETTKIREERMRQRLREQHTKLIK